MLFGCRLGESIDCSDRGSSVHPDSPMFLQAMPHSSLVPSLAMLFVVVVPSMLPLRFGDVRSGRAAEQDLVRGWMQ